MKKIFDNKFILYTVSGVLIVLIIVSISIFFSGFKSTLSMPTDDEVKFKNEYEELNNRATEDGKKYPRIQLPSSNLIKYSNIEEIINIFDNKGDAVIYFGYSTCLYCRNAVQVLIDTAVDTELDEILYINIEEYWDLKIVDNEGNIITTKQAHEKYDDLLQLLGEELVVDYVVNDQEGNEVNTESKRIQYPLVIFVVDGRVVSYNIGTLFSQEDPYVEMDSSQKQGLSEIYKYGIRDVLNSKKIKD